MSEGPLYIAACCHDFMNILELVHVSVVSVAERAYRPDCMLMHG